MHDSGEMLFDTIIIVVITSSEELVSLVCASFSTVSWPWAALSQHSPHSGFVLWAVNRKILPVAMTFVNDI